MRDHKELPKIQRKSAHSNATRGVTRVDAMIDRLRKCSDRMPMESAEYRLFELAIGSLIDARNYLVIIANRCD